MDMGLSVSDVHRFVDQQGAIDRDGEIEKQQQMFSDQWIVGRSKQNQRRC